MESNVVFLKMLFLFAVAITFLAMIEFIKDNDE